MSIYVYLVYLCLTLKFLPTQFYQFYQFYQTTYNESTNRTNLPTEQNIHTSTMSIKCCLSYLSMSIWSRKSIISILSIYLKYKAISNLSNMSIYLVYLIYLMYLVYIQNRENLNTRATSINHNLSSLISFYFQANPN
jgi:hypothetical protein